MFPEVLRPGAHAHLYNLNSSLMKFCLMQILILLSRRYTSIFSLNVHIQCNLETLKQSCKKDVSSLRKQKSNSFATRGLKICPFKKRCIKMLVSSRSNNFNWCNYELLEQQVAEFFIAYLQRKGTYPTNLSS